MAFTCFNLVIRDWVAVVEINLEKKANCMTREFWDELPKIMQTLDKDETVRVIIIHGKGKHFSSGIDANILFDIVDRESADKTAYIEKEIIKMQQAISSVERCSKPVIAAIHGACVGGAVDLITACDIRLASMRSAFCVLETKLGIVADLGTLQRLPLIVGQQWARELSYSSRMFTAYTAKKIGLIKSVHINKSQVLKASHHLASRIAAMPPLAVQGTKKSLNYSRDHSVDAGLKQIAEENAHNLQSHETATMINDLKKMINKSK